MESTKFSVKLILFLSGFSGIKAYAVILGILLVCGLGVPIPEDITLIAAGILAALKSITLMGAMIAGFVGVLLGDCILFFVGRRYGYHVFQLPIFNKIFTEKRIQIARQKVLSNSKFICFSARFLPGLRAPIFLTAGVMGVNPLTFILLDGFAALISVPIWVYFGWYFGSNLDYALHVALKAQKYIFSALAFLISGYIYWRYRQAKHEEKILRETEAPPKPLGEK